MAELSSLLVALKNMTLGSAKIQDAPLAIIVFISAQVLHGHNVWVISVAVF